MKKTKINSGIYIIYNHDTDDFYVGSSENLRARFSGHRSELRKGSHCNYKLQTMFDSGEQLTFSIIELTQDTLKRENEYFKILAPTINIAKDAAAPMKGRTHSPETRKRLSGYTPWNKGTPRTEEEKLLMSKNRKAVFDAMTEEEKTEWKLSRKHINHGKYWKGKNIAEGTKVKLRTYQLSKASSILCHQNGVVYLCQNDAAKALGLRQGHISEHLQGKRAAVKGYTFEKA